MVGPAVRRCLPSGKWSGYAPTCKCLMQEYTTRKKVETRAYLIKETNTHNTTGIRFAYDNIPHPSDHEAL